MSGNITGSHLRRFGITLALASSLLASILLWRGESLYPYFYWLAGIIMLFAVIYPRLLKPLDIISSFLLRIVGIIVGSIALTLVYYFVLTPAAIMLRIFRQETLTLKRDPAGASYWRPIDKGGSASRSDKPF